MYQIKIFKSLESDSARLEKDVNTWLKETNARVINIFGNLAPQSASFDDTPTSLKKSSYACSDIFLVVLYEESA